MKLNIATIVLDCMPYIGSHLPMLDTLKSDWHWVIAEGAAMNVRDTGWCKPQSPRLSRDGTTEYLNCIRNHPRVRVIQRQQWNGKTEQVNACLSLMKQPGVLLQIDGDEIWTAQQLETLVRLFETEPRIQSAAFHCRYFLGPNIIVSSNNTYTSHVGDWVRAWRFTPGMQFLKHEPPTFRTACLPQATREQTKKYGLVFDHYAYALESQVRYKETYYGYAGAVDGWRRLQANQKWPVRLGSFFPWVKDSTTADLLHRL